MPNTEPCAKGRRLLHVLAATLLGCGWQVAAAQVCCCAYSLLPGAAAVPEMTTSISVWPVALPLARGCCLSCATAVSCGRPIGVVPWPLAHAHDVARVSCNTQPFKLGEPDPSTDGGNLIEQHAFSCKMLGATVAHTQDSGKIIRDSSGGTRTQGEKAGDGGRRILWRQIQ